MKAVVVGSYERGDRSITVQRLAELAEFYGVPVSELLPGDAVPTPTATAPKLVIDLERMNQLSKEKVGPVARYVAAIQAQRGDYNGRVLSLGTRTCARSRSSTTSRRRTSPRSSSAGAYSTPTQASTRSSPSRELHPLAFMHPQMGQRQGQAWLVIDHQLALPQAIEGILRTTRTVSSACDSSQIRWHHGVHLFDRCQYCLISD